MLKRIKPEANPGGLVAHLYIDGKLVDSEALTDETTHGVGHRHASFAMDRISAGAVVVVRVYDGDTGRLVSELRAPE